MLSQLAESLFTSLKSDVVEREMERERELDGRFTLRRAKTQEPRKTVCMQSDTGERILHPTFLLDPVRQPHHVAVIQHTMMRWLQSCSLL